MTRRDVFERTILVVVGLLCIFAPPGAAVDLANWQAVTSVVVGLVLLLVTAYCAGRCDGRGHRHA